MWILLGVILFLIAAVLIISYVCFRLTFYVPNRDGLTRAPMNFLDESIYGKYLDQMHKWVEEVRQIPHEDVSITSFDGLTLRGTYYEYAPGAPIELMFHGYRGNAERDLSGGVQRCFQLGRSALLVDQRACGRSDGAVISFGINEHRDCLSWIAFMRQRFGEDVKIILTGISMGASTVMIAAGADLPDNVIGVLADCGYDSARRIIKIVIKRLKLPPALAYPFVRLGARLYGHFKLEEISPEEALKHSKVPVLIIHGEEDGFVPCDMGRVCYESCASPKKKFHTIPGAGHGLAYLTDPQNYLTVAGDFFSE